MMTMNRWCRVPALALGLQLALAGVCTAQAPAAGPAPAAAPAPVYLQVGPVLATHSEGEQDFRTSPALSGISVGGALSIGGWVSPVVALEAEAVVNGKLSDALQFSYGTGSTAYTAESRDILLGANLRLRPRPGARVELVVGGGLALTRFAQRDSVTTSAFPPIVSSRSRDVETSDWSPTFGAAVAGALPLSPRLDLVPSVGVRWIRREEFETNAWVFGLGRYSVTVGVALRVKP